ncbi:hypothetical protein [Caldivirga sp. MU80]|jgi:hypothetical protein|nr:hypothetical protein [Caldivirga sp. MU80]
MVKVSRLNRVPPRVLFRVLFTTFHYPELQANVLKPYILNPITKTAPL